MFTRARTTHAPTAHTGRTSVDMVRNPRPVSLGRVWTRDGVHGASLVPRETVDASRCVSERERHLARARGRGARVRVRAETPRAAIRDGRISLETRSCPLARASHPRRAGNAGRSTSEVEIPPWSAKPADAAFRRRLARRARATRSGRARAVSFAPKICTDLPIGIPGTFHRRPYPSSQRIEDRQPDESFGFSVRGAGQAGDGD